MLKTTQVKGVAIDPSQRLLIRRVLDGPEGFAFICRAAMGVAWDPDREALVTPEPAHFTHLDWFRQAARAVADEYARHLVVSESTGWSNVSEKLRRGIEQCCTSAAP